MVLTISDTLHLTPQKYFMYLTLTHPPFFPPHLPPLFGATPISCASRSTRLRALIASNKILAHHRLPFDSSSALPLDLPLHTSSRGPRANVHEEEVATN